MNTPRYRWISARTRLPWPTLIGTGVIVGLRSGAPPLRRARRQLLIGYGAAAVIPAGSAAGRRGLLRNIPLTVSPRPSPWTRALARDRPGRGEESGGATAPALTDNRGPVDVRPVPVARSGISESIGTEADAVDHRPGMESLYGSAPQRRRGSAQPCCGQPSTTDCQRSISEVSRAPAAACAESTLSTLGTRMDEPLH